MTPAPLVVGSICSGIGGLEQGLSLAGFDHTVAWFSESDSRVADVFQHHYPYANPVGDITSVDPKELPHVDLITAGFPCQDISSAGRQDGIHGERSGLWWTILDTISVLRPRHVFLENVAAILTTGGPEVIASLTEAGYDSRWTTVRASDIGAPHRRERWFCWASITDSDENGRPCWPVGLS